MVPFNPDILLSVWFILHSYVFVLLSHGTGKLVMCYLSCKVLKFILSALVLIAYAFFIGHEVVAFMLTYVFFFFAFLIFETRFFLWFEMKLKIVKGKQ